MNINIFYFFQSIILIILAPLFLGILIKIKAFLRGYKGQSIFQVYYDYKKMLSKDTIRSNSSSFITAIGPVISFSVSIVIAFVVPVFYTNSDVLIGNLFMIIFSLTIIKFFSVLIGLDCSSTFGGMGSSRELFLSMLVEPVIFLIIMYLFFQTGSFNISKIIFLNSNTTIFTVGNILALIAFFIVLIVENARLPIDNPETHLELTMIHEAMILDLSGKDLLLVEFASNIKFILFLTIFINIFIPYGIATSFTGIILLKSFLLFFIKMIFTLFLLGFIEILIAKSRLFRAPDLIATAFSIIIGAISLTFFIS